MKNPADHYVPRVDDSISDGRACITWTGSLRQGVGTVHTESGMLDDAEYSFRTPMLDGQVTNPDELIAASLGGCFSSSLASELGRAGFQPALVETETTASIEYCLDGWTLTRIHLDVHAVVPLVTEAVFDGAAMEAKMNCPIARLLNTAITMTTRLN